MRPAHLFFTASVLASLALVASPAVARETETKAEVNTTTMHDNGDVTTSRTTTNKTATGQSTTDRDTGLDRAEDRMSAEGRAHSHALKNHTPDGDEERSTTTTTTSTKTR
jgi:hypothetical protein